MLKNGKTYKFIYFNILIYLNVFILFLYRNYLHGRIAGNSLLGAMELERVLHNREVRIYVGTWNMNGQVNKTINKVNVLCNYLNFIGTST